MSGKRVLVLYGTLLLCFTAVVCRLYWLCSDTAYGARAAAQSVVTLRLPARRGNFYDHRGQLLTGQTTRWMALCVPGEGSYARLFSYTDAAGQAALYQKRNAASPFLLEVDRDVSALGVSCWPVERRNSAAPLAVQLLGYLDGEGHGAAGLEAAFDELLTGSGAGDTLLCTVNAQGKLRAEPVLTPADSGAVGVQLTLSREIQQTAEAVANETMQSGCILVLDTANANVRACVSRPGYDPENISASLNAPDSPLLERAFQCYAVGSVFKPVVAAAALEAGESGFVYTCPGGARWMAGFSAVRAAFPMARWIWPARWKRAATATSSGWGRRWGPMPSAPWQSSWASGRRSRSPMPCTRRLGSCQSGKPLRPAGPTPISALGRGSCWHPPSRSPP